MPHHRQGYKRMTKGNAVHCPRCKIAVSRIYDLGRHMRKHCEAKQVWQCSQCDKRFFQRRKQLEEHFHTTHPKNWTLHQGVAISRTPDREALGCGFCSTCFVGHTEAYIEHIIAHYKIEKRTIEEWDVSTQIKSLLMQPHVLREWYEICYVRFECDSDRWPSMRWSNADAAYLARFLERRLSHKDLRQVLTKALDLAK